MLVGYARVSSATQSLEIQLAALEAAGCEKLFSEKRSGPALKIVFALADAVDWCRKGDTLVVTRLDRLARSVADLFSVIERLTLKRVNFTCLQQSRVDTDSSIGRLMLAILVAVAAFETDIRKDVSGKVSRRPKLLGAIVDARPRLIVKQSDPYALRVSDQARPQDDFGLEEQVSIEPSPSQVSVIHYERNGR